MISLTGALGAATSFLTMRIMRNDIHYSISPFWWAIGCAFICPIFSLNQMRQEPITSTYSYELVGLTIAVSIASFLGQIF